MFPQNGRPTVHAVPDAIGFDDGEWTKAPVEYDVDPDAPYYYRETGEPASTEEPEPSETAPADDTDKAEAEETKAETEEVSENTEKTESEAAPANTEPQSNGGISAGTLVLIIVVVVLLASGVSAAVTISIIKKNKKD